MPIVKDVTIYWAKLDPEFPVAKYKQEHVKEWTLEARTTDPKIAKMWKDEYHFNMKKVEDKNTGETYYRARLQKRAIDTSKPNAKMAFPVEVLDPQLNPIDPKILGNGSVADVMVFLREWEKFGEKGYTPDLRKLRVKKLVEYYREFEEFDKLDEELEVIDTVTDVKPASEKPKSKEPEREIDDLDDAIYD